MEHTVAGAPAAEEAENGAHRMVPFIITERLKYFYYRGIQQWPHLPGYLRDTCLSAQDEYRAILAKLCIDT